jgi:hypothetical protein
MVNDLLLERLKPAEIAGLFLPSGIAAPAAWNGA